MDANANQAAVDLRQTLIEVSIEGWRMAKLFGRVLGKLEASESNRYANQVRYFQKRLEDELSSTGLRLVNLEGLPYDLGMAVTALNIGDFEPEEPLLVDQMIEPILMGPDGVVKSGTAMLKRAD